MNQNRYVIHLSYLGTNYGGWQIQENSRTIQGDIMSGLKILLNQNIELIVGVGRTDAGVHASNFFAHFDFNELFNFTELTYKLNRFLSDKIVIHYIKPISKNFHARFSAVSRSYEYLICTEKNPFLINRAYFFFKRLNLDIMNQASLILIGENNFSSFSKSNKENTICCVKSAEWNKKKEIISFSIESDRYLYNMVRCIVGTLIDLGLEKINLNQFIDIIKSGDRKQAGISVPAQGLYLVNIRYPKNFSLEII